MDLNKWWFFPIICLLGFLLGLSGNYIRTDKIAQHNQEANYAKKFSNATSEQKQAENEAKRANKRADEAEKQQDEMARMTTYVKAHQSQLQQAEMKLAYKHYRKASSSSVTIIPLTNTQWTTNADGKKIISSVTFVDPYSGRESVIYYRENGNVDSFSGSLGNVADVAHTDNADGLFNIPADSTYWSKTGETIKTHNKYLSGQKIDLLVSRPTSVQDNEGAWALQRVTFKYVK